MELQLKYITDQNGHQTAVVIPMKNWEKFQKEHQKLENKIKVLNGIADALDEVEEIKKGKKKGKSLREFLEVEESKSQVLENEQISPTYLFGKWKDLDINPKTYRKQLWKRKS